MKNISVTMGLAAVLAAGGAMAQDITISWWVTGTNIGTGYLPKVATDGIENAVTIDQINMGPRGTLNGLPTGVSAFQTRIGTLDAHKVAWTGGWDDLYSPPQTTPQIGLAPSIALAYAATDNNDAAIEVHQGAQESDGSLWYQIGSFPDPFSEIVWGTAINYGTGYNATVAADLNGEKKTTTVVEVHQESSGASALYYKVGVLTVDPSPSISWGPTTLVNMGMDVGSMPTVSVAGNFAVLVAQGAPGALWYAIGKVDLATSTIDWSDANPYGGGGYNPTVSVWETSSISDIRGRVVVEAHQLDSLGGTLVYNTGLLKDGTGGTPPTSIDWNPNSNMPYSNGCYPSVALAFDGYTPANAEGATSYISLTETHETACGTAPIEYSFGYLVSN